ncbi:unnamed protein product, partial [Polarella glacialis]
ECSIRWSGHLHTFFQQRGYHFVTSHYGLQFDGYMGIGIAFPSRKFELLATSMQRVSEGKAWDRERRPEVPPGKKLLTTLLDFAGYFASPLLLRQADDTDEFEDSNEDPWVYSRK